MGTLHDDHMVDVTTMEPAGEGGNAIQVLLAASSAAHEEPGHVLQPAMDAHLLSQQYVHAYDEVAAMLANSMMHGTLAPHCAAECVRYHLSWCRVCRGR